MSRFQQGSLFRVKRKSCAGVWVFRWYDYTTGRRIYKKQIIGTTGQLQSRRDAEKAVLAVRFQQVVHLIPVSRDTQDS